MTRPDESIDNVDTAFQAKYLSGEPNSCEKDQGFVPLSIPSISAAVPLS